MRLVWAILATITTLAATATAAGERQPMGAWFGGYEKLMLDDEVVWPSGAAIVTDYTSPGEDLLAEENLRKYAAVYFGWYGARPLMAEEQQRLEAWVAAGGDLVLPADEGERMFGGMPPAWLGIKGWQAVDERVASSVRLADHPLAAGLNQVGGPDSQWRANPAIVPLADKNRVEVVIGTDELATLVAVRHGQGRVIHLGGTLYPQGRPAYAEKQVTRDMTPLAVAVWRNLTAYLDVPNRSAAIGNWSSRHPLDNGQLAFWRRYQPQTPLGGKLYWPPYPEQGEELEELSLTAGMGERLYDSFFVTSLAPAKITIESTDLVGPAGRIPARQLRVFVQSAPAPDYPKGCYWLVPPPAEGHTLPGRETSTFWVLLDTSGSAPGVYQGAIELIDPERRVIGRLPVRLKTLDLHAPGPDRLHFEMEHCWFTMPGGYRIEKDGSRMATVSLDGRPLVETPLNDPDVLGNYMEALGELGVDFAQSWSDVDRLYPLDYVRLRETGRTLPEEIAEHPERFQGDKLPALDFSHVYDPYFDRAVPAGMRYFAMNYHLSYDGALGLAQRLAGDDGLPAESPLVEKVRTWWWSEYAQYIRERGLLDVYTKIMDEFSASDTGDFIPSARAIRRAGFRTYTTTYNFHNDPNAVQTIDPVLDLWQMGWPNRNPHEELREAGIPFEPANEVWGTTASSYWGNYIDYARSAGWLAARVGYGGLHTHGYMRWHWNDREGCFPGPRGPYHSVAAVSYAQGINEGRWLAQLLEMLDYARSNGLANEVADAVAAQLKTEVIGNGDHCLLRVHNQPWIPGGGFPEYWWTDTSLPTDNFRAARLRVLELTSRLKAALGPIRPVCRYGDFVLVRDGQRVATLVGPSDAVAALDQELITAAGPTDPPEPGGPQVVVGTLADKAVRELAQGPLAGQITEHYPHAGSYMIRRLAAEGGRPASVLIVGGDAAGLTKGIKNFVRLLSADQRW